MAHEGHRQRMYEKLKSGGPIAQHELLEILLYNAYPRKNTNPIAHALIEAFGSVKNVLAADIEELTSVEGVGESVALYLTTVGRCANIAAGSVESDVYFKSYGDFKSFAAYRLRDKQREVLEIYFFEKSGRLKYLYSKTTEDVHRVKVERDEVAKLVAKIKPYGIMIAHNHITGTSEPSPDDDKFTAEMQLLCSMSGISLYDHCIYASDNDVYSYFNAGRIDGIKEKYRINKVIKQGF